MTVTFKGERNQPGWYLVETNGIGTFSVSAENGNDAINIVQRMIKENTKRNGNSFTGMSLRGRINNWTVYGPIDECK